MTDNIIPLKRPPDLTAAEMVTINKGHCPDCNHRGFVLGPRGGASINIECGGCANRFNVALWRGRTVMGQRIPREDQGGSNWVTP